MGATNTKSSKQINIKADRKPNNRKKLAENSARDERHFQATNTNVANNQVQDKLKRIFKRRRSQQNAQSTGDEKICDWLEKNKANYKALPSHIVYIPDYLKPNCEGEEGVDDLSISQDSISSNVDMNNDNQRHAEMLHFDTNYQGTVNSQSYRPRSSFSLLRVFKWKASTPNRESTGDVDYSMTGTTRNSQWTDIFHSKPPPTQKKKNLRGKNFSRKRIQKRSLSTTVQQNSDLSINHSRVRSNVTDFNKI